MKTLITTAFDLSYCIWQSREMGATEAELEQLKVAMQNLARAVETLREYGVEQ